MIIQVNKAYVALTSGWVKLIDENDSVGDLSNVNITGVSNGNGLIWSSAQGRFNVGCFAFYWFQYCNGGRLYNKEKRWHKTLEDM